MPHYPCIKCDGLVDTHNDVVCRECGEKRPFACSKCGKGMNQVDIFQLEKLKTKKPLLCMDCGTANEVVKCGICKGSLVRATGRQLSEAPGAKVYHKDCYEKQMGVVAMTRKLFPVFAAIGLACGYFLGGPIAAAIGAAAFLGLGWMGVQILIPK
ncbi:MAG: hypothetical protein HY319_09670 [Armatimonadetes bacterium]|nr:hypothetical protein [Armatimonadota bacterium]